MDDRPTPAPPAGDALRIAVYMHDLAGGGVEKMTLDLLHEFKARGHHVTLLLHALEGPLIGRLPPDLDMQVFSTSRVLADIAPLARYLSTHQPDILLSSLNHNNIAALLAKLRSASRTRLIICQHNALSAEASGMSGWKYAVVPGFYRVLAPLAAGIVAVSDGVADDIAATSGIRRARMTTIYNPVIAPDFAASADQPVDHPWFEAPGPPLYLAVGRLVPQKDHHTLLRAFALHCAGGIEARLVILGEGPLRDELTAHAELLGIAERVAMPGYVANPLPYMRRATALLLTSRYEGFGNVLVEALGVGTPVVAMNCSFGPSEILEGGRFGHLIAKDDIGALAQVLSPDLRERWPAALLQRRAQDFTVGASAERYLELMREVMAKKTGRKRVLF